MTATMRCPYCGHDQPPATYCLQCRLHMKRYVALKEKLEEFERRLRALRQIIQSGGAPEAALDQLTGLGTVYQGLRESFDQLSLSQREMGTLAEVGKAINSVTETGRLLDLIMDMAIKVMNAQRGFLMLKDQETGELKVDVARNMEAELRDPAQRMISSNVSIQVANDGRPIIATDAMGDKRFKDMRSVVAQNVRSLLCVPLKLKSGEIIGVIYVDHHLRTAAFTDDSLEFLTGFANQAAIAIENARLYENIQRETAVRMTLQRYLSPSVVDDIMEQKEVLALGGKRADCTVLFADICGFTQISHKLEPEDVVRLLNEYLSIIADLIFEHRGTLDKFIGDAAMAVFGAPVANPNHALDAVLAAMAMQDAVKRREADSLRRWGAPIQVRIGINSGVVVAGNVGSPTRMEYTIIGDNVNVASRLQAGAPPGGVLVSDATYRQIKPYVKARPAAPIQLKGRTDPIGAYEVLEIVSVPTSEKNLRKHNRMEVSLFAIYRDPEKSRVHQGVVKNLSRGGFALNTREEYLRGSELVLSFNLPGGDKLGDVRGRVVRSQRLLDDQGKPYFKLGAEFTNFPETDWEKLARSSKPT